MASARNDAKQDGTAPISGEPALMRHPVEWKDRNSLKGCM